MILKKTIRRSAGQWPLFSGALAVVLGAVVCSSIGVMIFTSGSSSPQVALINFDFSDIPLRSEANSDREEQDALVLALASSPDESALDAAEVQDLPIVDEEPSVSRRMSLAFADLPEAESVGGRRMLNVSFDLGARGVRAGDLEVSKQVNLDGRSVGTVGVVIDQYSQLHVSTADLSEVLPAELFTQITAEGDYVAFDALRTSGINVRYDPVNDILVMAS